MARKYSSIAEAKTLTANVASNATQITLSNVTGLPSQPYVLVLNPDTANEEAVLVTSDQAGVTSPTLKVTRAIETNATAKTHTNGDTVKHMIVGSDLQLVHDHIDLTTNVHGYTATAAEINILDGATLSTTELNYVDGVTSAIQTQLNTKAPLASPTFTGTVTLPTGTVTSGMILDGTIVNADINASAAIDWTKLAVSSTVSSTELGYVDGVTSAIQTQLDSKAPLNPSTNAQTGTTYTLVLSDAGKYVEMNNASANTLTVPPNSEVAFPVGTEVTVIRTGAGLTTIAPGSGVTVNYYSVSGSATRSIKGQWSAATLVKRATDTWVLIGNLT